MTIKEPREFVLRHEDRRHEANRPFFDRHFGALVGAFAIIVAGAIGVMFSDARNYVEIEKIDVIPDRPVEGELVLFDAVVKNQADADGFEFSISKVGTDDVTPDWQESDHLRLQINEAGEYIVMVVAKKGDRILSTASQRFDVAEATADSSDPQGANGDQEEIIMQEFRQSIGNPGSCTEKNVQRKFNLCLPEGYIVTDYDEKINSLRNGGSRILLDEARENCLIAFLEYSDSGRSFLGDCRGNGWIETTVTVRGAKKIPDDASL